jgi:hypothetical protein
MRSSRNLRRGHYELPQISIRTTGSPPSSPNSHSPSEKVTNRLRVCLSPANATALHQELEDRATGILYSRLYGHRRHTVAERALTASVLLLPSAHRARWLEERTGELSVSLTHCVRARFAVQMLWNATLCGGPPPTRQPYSHRMIGARSTVISPVFSQPMQQFCIEWPIELGLGAVDH